MGIKLIETALLLRNFFFVNNNATIEMNQCKLIYEISIERIGFISKLFVSIEESLFGIDRARY